MLSKKWMIAIISAAFVIFAIVFISVQQATTPEKTVEKFEAAVEKKQPKELKNLIVTDNKKAAVNDASINAMIDYLKRNNNSFQVIKDSLNKQIQDKDFTTTNQQISLVRHGKKWGLFSDYKLKVKTVSIKVTGQNEDDKINLSVKNANNLLKKEDKEMYGPVLPGHYELLITVKNKLGTFMDKKKTEVWGNKQITVLIDSNKLARNDKEIQKNIMAAVDLFNRDLSVFETSGFDTDTLTNVTEAIKSDHSFVKDDFEIIKDYVDEMHSQYLGAVVNLDELHVDFFEQSWSAEVTAFVSYNNKLKSKTDTKFRDLSYKSIRDYSLKYDAEGKKWLIDKIQETKADDSEHQAWKNKQDMKIENPPVMKWNRTDKGIDL